jgi:hypothetical protein
MQADTAVRSNSFAVAKPSPTIPDYLIKYEPVNEPSPPGGLEEQVCGTEADAIEVVQRLIENGRTTPGRVRIYGNLNPIIQTSVSFPPSGRPTSR